MTQNVHIAALLRWTLRTDERISADLRLATSRAFIYGT
jgi:hypothetical protein